MKKLSRRVDNVNQSNFRPSACMKPRPSRDMGPFVNRWNIDKSSDAIRIPVRNGYIRFCLLVSDQLSLHVTRPSANPVSSITFERLQPWVMGLWPAFSYSRTPFRRQSLQHPQPWRCLFTWVHPSLQQHYLRLCLCLKTTHYIDNKKLRKIEHYEHWPLTIAETGPFIDSPVPLS